MIAEGDAAPEFTLPAVVDGDFDEISLSDFLGDDIVILAFYPADFNPACSGETTDLDELDLFTMQKDVSILGISTDSIYSHRAFAEEYDLDIPLLADVHGITAADYDIVTTSSDGVLMNRAVVVIDPGGEVQYTWETSDLKRLPPVENVRKAVDDIGGEDTAEARYRVGHAHYVEGRRAFTRAMGGFEEMEWMMAQGNFSRAHEEFEEAADQFNTAVRFSESEESLKYFERAEEKAESLWQAAEWLAEASSAYASGEGAEGEDMRSDAEGPLKTARDIHEPPDPSDFPPEEDPADIEQKEQESVLPTEDEGPPASLDADLDDGESPEADALADEMTEETAPDATAAATSGDDQQDDDDEEEDEIDDEELEEIAAELEEQTEKAKQKREQEDDDLDDEIGVVPDDASELVDDPGDEDGDADEATAAGTDDAAASTESDDGGSGTETGDEDADEDEEEDIELDLADPTEGTDVEPDDAADVDADEDDEDEDEDEDEEVDENLGSGGGDHGVPDSL